MIIYLLFISTVFIINVKKYILLYVILKSRHGEYIFTYDMMYHLFVGIIFNKTRFRYIRGRGTVYKHIKAIPANSN